MRWHSWAGTLGHKAEPQFKIDLRRFRQLR